MTVGPSDQRPHPSQQHGPTSVHHPRPHHHSLHHEQTREHEKLRLALGSILSPKRLSTPSSRASSGTASPCPAHFGPGLVHPYHPGPSHLHTPIESHAESNESGHSFTGATIHEAKGVDERVYPHPVAGIPPKKSSPSLSRANSSSLVSHDYHDHSESASPTAAPPILTTSNVHSLSPRQAQFVKEAQNTYGTSTMHEGHERGHLDSHLPNDPDHRHHHQNSCTSHPGHRGGFGAYVATLQSARAWDALVHGNMS